MTLAARRLYIDSALRTAGTAEDFTYQLPVSLDVPEGVIAYVDSVTIPQVFRTLNADNRYLYLHEQDANGQDYFSKVTLDVGDYDGMSLAAHLLVQLSAATQVSQFYTVTYVPETNVMQITPMTGLPWAIWSRKSLQNDRSVWTGANYEASHPRDANAVIGWPDSYGRTLSNTAVLLQATNVHPYQNLNVHSPNLGKIGESYGPSGEQTIIRRVPLTVPAGNIQHHDYSLPHDWIDVGGHVLQSIQFRLTDHRNITVDLNGLDWSMSIVLVEKSD